MDLPVDWLLCECSTPPLGISTGSIHGDTLVAVTFSHLGIQLYNLKDRKLSCSWSLEPGKILSRHAIIHPLTGKILCVEDCRILHFLNKDNLSLHKTLSLTLKSEVFSLHATKHWSGVILVLLNGSVCLCSQSEIANSPIVSTVCDKEDIVLFSQLSTSISNTKDHPIFLMVISKNKGKENKADKRWNYFLSIYQINVKEKNNKTKEKYECKLVNRSMLIKSMLSKEDKAIDSNEGTIESIQSAAFDFQNHYLSVIWSDGSWEVFQLTKIGTPTFSFQTHANLKFSFTRLFADFAHISTIFVKPSRLAMISIGQEQRTNSTNLLTFWETLYGTLQAKHDIGTCRNQTNSITDIQLQICSTLDSSFCISLWPDAVRVHPINFNSSAPSLFTSIGRAVSNTSFSEDLPASERSSASLDEIDDQNKDSFQTIFNQWRKKEKKKRERKEKKKRERKENGDPNPKTKRQRLSQQFISFATTKCIAKSLWESLSYLIDSESVSAAACPALIKNLILQNQPALLGQCLIYIHDVSEPELINIIKFILKTDYDLQHKEFIKLFNLVLWYPHRNKIFLQEATKSLEDDHVTRLLKFLVDWFESHWKPISGGWEGEATHMNSTTKHSFVNMIDWATAILNGQFNNLFGTNPTLPLAKEALRLAKVIQEHKELYSEINQLIPYAHLFSKQIAECHKPDCAHVAKVFCVNSGKYFCQSCIFFEHRKIKQKNPRTIPLVKKEEIDEIPLLVLNISNDITNDQFRNFFTKFGELSECTLNLRQPRIFEKSNRRNNKRGIVIFKSKEATQQAIIHVQREKQWHIKKVRGLHKGNDDKSTVSNDSTLICHNYQIELITF